MKNITKNKEEDYERDHMINLYYDICMAPEGQVEDPLDHHQSNEVWHKAANGVHAFQVWEISMAVKAWVLEGVS